MPRNSLQLETNAEPILFMSLLICESILHSDEFVAFLHHEAIEFPKYLLTPPTNSILSGAVAAAAYLGIKIHCFMLQNTSSSFGKIVEGQFMFVEGGEWNSCKLNFAR